LTWCTCYNMLSYVKTQWLNIFSIHQYHKKTQTNTHKETAREQKYLLTVVQQAMNLASIWLQLELQTGTQATMIVPWSLCKLSKSKVNNHKYIVEWQLHITTNFMSVTWIKKLNYNQVYNSTHIGITAAATNTKRLILYLLILLSIIMIIF